MTELLCLKSGCGRYVRTTGDSWELTSMSKATVYTIEHKPQLVELLDRLRSSHMNVYCVKLTITEERYDL